MKHVRKFTLLLALIVAAISCTRHSSEPDTVPTGDSTVEPVEERELNFLYEPEVMAWGNLNGIRIAGELMAFKTSLRLVEPDWDGIVETARANNEQQHGYERSGNAQITSGRLGTVSYREEFAALAEGEISLTIDTTAEDDAEAAGIYLYVELPGDDFRTGTLQFVENDGVTEKALVLSMLAQNNFERVEQPAKNLSIRSTRRKLDIYFPVLKNVIVERVVGRDAENPNIGIYIPLQKGDIGKGDATHSKFTLAISGDIDQSPVEMFVDSSNPGPAFDGLGGNFRLQKPDLDPRVIQYNLENMRVAWGRVEMPWQLWHPEENEGPVAAAKQGGLHSHVESSMKMAQTLHQQGMPVIVSAWRAPQWAVLGEIRRGGEPDEQGRRGNALNPEKMDAIIRSITSYIIYLKENYGVEATMFSLNESDLGIDIRQTAEEHRDLIKTLGAHMTASGLKTKMLLGDTSDATATDFIIPTLHDKQALKYVGAVSYHSWRGWTDELLAFWGDTARKIGVPLIVGEGSTDAAAWRYGGIFDEYSFALHEINLYNRICALSRPLSILQWQLTADYSVLMGQGIYDSTGPLRPTHRFWNLKQLASTPAGAAVLPMDCGNNNISCVAYGDTDNSRYAIHIVNLGAERAALVRGLPADVKQLRVYVTDPQNGMSKGEVIPVVNGEFEVDLAAAGFTSLFTE